MMLTDTRTPLLFVSSSLIVGSKPLDTSMRILVSTSIRFMRDRAILACVSALPTQRCAYLRGLSTCLQRLACASYSTVVGILKTALFVETEHIPIPFVVQEIILEPFLKLHLQRLWPKPPMDHLSQPISYSLTTSLPTGNLWPPDCSDRTTPVSQNRSACMKKVIICSDPLLLEYLVTALIMYRDREWSC